MTTPAHFFGGYLVLRLTQRWWALDLSEVLQRRLIMYGFLLSVLIDLDVLATRGITGHHQQLTHYPVFWLGVSFFIWLIGKARQKKNWQAFALVTLIGSWLHLALDLVGVTMGIYALWPFSNQEFSITPLTTNFPTEKERLEFIFRSPVMWIGDSVVILLGIWQFVRDVATKKAKLSLPTES